MNLYCPSDVSIHAPGLFKEKSIPIFIIISYILLPRTAPSAAPTRREVIKSYKAPF